MKIKSLTLRARAVVEGLQSGVHRSPAHGFSAEFSEYRQFSRGDDPRYIDWRLYARSDRHYIKRFEDETNRRCYLLVDFSPSMQYHSGDATTDSAARTNAPQHSKLDYARTLAATLIYFLIQQRDSVGLLLFAQDILDFHEANLRGGQRSRLLAALERPASGAATNVTRPLEQVARTVRRRGLVVLISDLLGPLDQWNSQLGALRARGHEVLVLQVLDPAEVDFPFTQASQFRDHESGERKFVDPATARRQYLARFEQHQQQMRDACEHWGIGQATLQTNQPLDSALFDLIRSQVARSATRTRRRRP